MVSILPTSLHIWRCSYQEEEDTYHTYIHTMALVKLNHNCNYCKPLQHCLFFIFFFCNWKSKKSTARKENVIIMKITKILLFISGLGGVEKSNAAVEISKAAIHICQFCISHSNIQKKIYKFYSFLTQIHHVRNVFWLCILLSACSNSSTWHRLLPVFLLDTPYIHVPVILVSIRISLLLKTNFESISNSSLIQNFILIK